MPFDAMPTVGFDKWSAATQPHNVYPGRMGLDWNSPFVNSSMLGAWYGTMEYNLYTGQPSSRASGSKGRVRYGQMGPVVAGSSANQVAVKHPEYDIATDGYTIYFHYTSSYSYRTIAQSNSKGTHGGSYSSRFIEYLSQNLRVTQEGGPVLSNASMVSSTMPASTSCVVSIDPSGDCLRCNYNHDTDTMNIAEGTITLSKPEVVSGWSLMSPETDIFETAIEGALGAFGVWKGKLPTPALLKLARQPYQIFSPADPTFDLSLLTGAGPANAALLTHPHRHTNLGFA